MIKLKVITPATPSGGGGIYQIQIAASASRDHETTMLTLKSNSYYYASTQHEEIPWSFRLNCFLAGTIYGVFAKFTGYGDAFRFSQSDIRDKVLASSDWVNSQFTRFMPRGFGRTELMQQVDGMIDAFIEMLLAAPEE